MSYTTDAVTSKLSGLNDTQESITSISQWIMFHRRHAPQTVKTWLQYLQEASNHRKLHLIYLANEVVQQSRARKKEEFLNAFTPVIVDAIRDAYAKVNSDLRNKIRRVVGVWRQRNIFSVNVLDALESSMDQINKGKSSAPSAARKAAPIAGLPTEISKLVNSQQQLNAALSSTGLAVGSALNEYTQLIDNEALPAPPVYAARLVQLLRTLENAVSNAGAAVAIRQDIVKQLDTLLAVNKASLESEINQVKDLEKRQQKANETRAEVEAMILNNMGENSGGNRSTTPVEEPPSPDFEALTPPAEASRLEDSSSATGLASTFEPTQMAMYIEEDDGLNSVDVDPQMAALINSE